MRKVKFQEGGNVRGPTRDVSEWTDQELDAAIYAQETAETPSMERPAGPRLNVGPRARMSPPTGIYTLADLRNERRRRQPASRRYAPFEGQPGGEVTEEETRPAPRASAPATMPRYNQGPSAAEAIDRAANRARTPPPPAPSRGATAEMQTADVPGNRASTPSGSAATARMREIDMQGADVPGNRGMSPVARPRPPARPAAAPAAAARPRSRMSEADRLNQMELDRIEQDRIDADRRGLAEAARRRREVTPERGAPGTGNFFTDLGNFARALTGQSVEYKKGGKVKKYREGGNVTDSSQDEETNRRQIELGRLYDTPGMSSRGRGKVQLMEQSLPGIMHPEDTKTGAKQRALREELRQALDRGEDVEIFMDRLVRRNPRKSFKTQEYKKGGMVKPKTAMKKGGMVKPKAPATKMKAGGKVAPKKMMKGGMTSKPKKMMGGGRAMYAKGGMAKGCK